MKKGVRIVPHIQLDFGYSSEGKCRKGIQRLPQFLFKTFFPESCNIACALVTILRSNLSATLFD